MWRPTSCDTFVVLPPATANNYIIFGKNSDRPNDEVQEVVYIPPADNAPGKKIQCTYIEIDQAEHTHGVILSKPAWMWGAEMGANDKGVVIGNEAVWTKMNSPADKEEKLLGMDLLRLGLERSSTARKAVDIITGLLEKHGQGGSCSDDPVSPMTYQNGFLIADSKEAWVVETAGKMWAAEQVTSGCRNISNQLTIRTKIDLMSSNLKEHAIEKGWWKSEDGDFDFALAYSDTFEETELVKGNPPASRLQWGQKLSKEFSAEGKFSAADMFKILRHEESGICMSGSFLSTGSQVSVLPQDMGNAAACHWFTATPDPSKSLYKPFVFCENNTVGMATTSPTFGADDPVLSKPRFSKTVDRRHALWKAHEKLISMLSEGSSKGSMILEQMLMMEAHCVADMDEVVRNFDDGAKTRVANIFKHMVELEMNFYK